MGQAQAAAWAGSRLVVAAGFGLDPGAADQAGLDDGLHGLGAVPHDGPRLAGSFRDHGVEIVAGDHVAVAGKIRVLGPGQLEGATERVRAQPHEAVAGTGQLVAESHVLELAHRTRGKAVAARLLAGVPLPLHQHHVVPGAGQPVGAGGAGGAATDDENVAAAGGDRGGVVHSEQSRRLREVAA